MHRALAAWLSERPWAAALMATGFAFLSPQGLSPFAVVAGAVPVLLALQRTPQTGVMAASVAGAAAFGTLLGGGVPFVVAAASVLLVFAAPLGLERHGGGQCSETEQPRQAPATEVGCPIECQIVR